MHTHFSLGAGSDFLDFLDNLGKLGRTNTVLEYYIADSSSVVILLAEFGVRGVCVWFVVQENFAAGIAGCFQCGLDQSNKANVNNRKFELNVTKVARAFVVLTIVSWTNKTWFNYSHVRVHQTLAVGMSIIFVGISSLDFYSRHLSNFAWVHETKSNARYSLGYKGGYSAHLRSSSSNLMATPKLFISSSNSLNAYEVCTL